MVKKKGKKRENQRVGVGRGGKRRESGEQRVAELGESRRGGRDMCRGMKRG